MQSRRDQVQAYAFATSRLATALTTGTPGNGETPFRRASVGAFAGVAVAVLLAAAAFIYGLIRPAVPTTWRQQGAVDVVKETGTRYVYLNGVLHPMANYTSAALIGGRAAAVQYVSQKTLAGVPIGTTIGIPDAPQTLPAASALLGGTWAVCLPPDAPGGTFLDLAPGRHATASLSGRKIVVVAPDGTGYVLWDDVKYQLTSESVLIALGLGNQVPIQASAAWLSDVRTGPPLAPAVIAHAGKPGPPVGGRPATIGTVFQTTAAGVDQYYVLLTNGLAPASRTEAALMSAGGHHPGPAQQVSPAAIAAAPASADRSLLKRVPDLLGAPVYISSGAALCIRQQSPGSVSADTVITDQVTGGAAAVIVPAGAGVIASGPAPAASSPAPSYLITDAGVKYLLANGNAATALGYGGLTPVVLPPAVLGSVPTGPVLSIPAAEKAVPAT